MVWAQRVGLKIGLLSARNSATTAQRAAQLGITLVHQGVVSKIEAYDEIVGDIGLNDEEVAYMGDDIVDIAVLSRVGLAAAPADAVAEVRERVHWVAPSAGGAGAARELLELILRAQDRWDAIVRSFTPLTSGAERA
jgi:3-deoxy-D-manno-octulosonate 8-phosphate phosphatase (KDO 8-P phosphatase)